ncbi:hypothetical protein L6R50_07145 [Myxococcota bacterium]|nr:hypothetical protein [Myxococcota bacterium]
MPRIARIVPLAALLAVAAALADPRVPGARAAEDRAEAGTVVVCPDFPLSARVFRGGPSGGLAGALERAGHRVVEVDPWAEGHRDALDLEGVLDGPVATALEEARTHRRPVAWIGHGVCGLLPAYAAARRSPAPDLLVALGTPFDFSLPSPALRRFLADPGDTGARDVLWRNGIGARERIPFPDVPPAPWVLRDLREGWESGRGPRVAGVTFDDAIGAWNRPLLVVAGSVDGIAPPEDALRGHRLAPSTDRTFRVVGWADHARGDYGHLGLLLGDRAHRDVWRHLVAWLGERLGDRGGRGRR